MQRDAAADDTLRDAGATLPAPQVRHFRQVLLWPLRLMAAPGEHQRQRRPWETLAALGSASPWQPVIDEYKGDRDSFHERHYNEFVTFLPFVQRFLYGEGRSAHRAGGDSPMQVFRRRDIARARVQAHPGDAPLLLDVVHIDLYFFYDVDVVMLNVEVAANDVPLPLVQELLYRFGRAYPGGWDEHGQAQHCMASVEWLGRDGTVLARSDSQQCDPFLAHVAAHRAPRFASHWAFVLEPLVADHSDREGALRVRQIQYYRMPVMAYVAVDRPRDLTRADFIRLGLVTGMRGTDTLPYAEAHLADFDQRYCYDRFWSDAGSAPNTRFMCCGHALVVVGDANSRFYRCAERGVLAQFRHQHFLLFVIAHFQKAALLMYSDRLSEALKALDVTDAASVKVFKRAIRLSFEAFLRFTHRYWFHEVSEQAQVRSLFRMCAGHLGLEELYAEVKERVEDMNTYLEGDSLRRQANTVVRLTVVTIFGLVGTIATGFLGMNLIAAADEPLLHRVAAFAALILATGALTFYTIAKSRRLSDFLDALSDERVRTWDKLRALAAVWQRDH